MNALLEVWKAARKSPYSGDLAVGFLVAGLLIGGLGWGKVAAAGVGSGLALLSATLDLIPDESDSSTSPHSNE